VVKNDLVKATSLALRLNEYEALDIVDATVEAVKETVSVDKRLEVRGFGVFKVCHRRARVGRNPRNKKAYPITARSSVTFRPGKSIKESMQALDRKGEPAEEPAEL
jgi:nucleoid DNA-binding protein